MNALNGQPFQLTENTDGCLPDIETGELAYRLHSSSGKPIYLTPQGEIKTRNPQPDWLLAGISRKLACIQKCADGWGVPSVEHLDGFADYLDTLLCLISDAPIELPELDAVDALARTITQQSSN